jgi:hypothetical protein
MHQQFARRGRVAHTRPARLKTRVLLMPSALHATHEQRQGTLMMWCSGGDAVG